MLVLVASCSGGSPLSGSIVLVRGSERVEIHPTICAPMTGHIRLEDDASHTHLDLETSGGGGPGHPQSLATVTFYPVPNDEDTLVTAVSERCSAFDGSLTWNGTSREDGRLAGTVHLACADVGGYAVSGDLTLSGCHY